MKYFFVLGKNPALSAAELCSALPGAVFEYIKPNILFAETEKELDAPKLMERLGGTIKIGAVAGKISSLRELPGLAAKITEKTGRKIIFGLSDYVDYSPVDIKRAAMELKKKLKDYGAVRWAISKEKILSSVIVKTNKLVEQGAEICLFRGGWVGKTLAVQEFEKYEERDFGKPGRNIMRGMMPPKLAQILINLSCAEKDGLLLDPFCGTGTVLTEAMVMGFEKLAGSDSDLKAISETKENVGWLIKKYGGGADLKLIVSSADKISEKMARDSVGAIATEPYLGPLLRGGESEAQIRKVADGLSELYLSAFADWKKILRKNARVAMIFPVFKTRSKPIELGISEKIEKLGYEKIRFPVIGGLDLNKLVYERPDQKVIRAIDIFRKI